MKGQGVPRLDGRGRGSLAVVVQVDVPTVLTERARGLLAELDNELRREGSTSRPAGDPDGKHRKAASAK
jgi:molecular chaperone DnaJ